MALFLSILQPLRSVSRHSLLFWMNEKPALGNEDEEHKYRLSLGKKVLISQGKEENVHSSLNLQKLAKYLDNIVKVTPVVRIRHS